MAGTQELVDLSLFATSPAFDRHFALPDVPGPEHIDQPDTQLMRNLSRPLPRDYSSKPLPPLPRRRRPIPRCPTPKRCDIESHCIINKIKRARSNEQAPSQNMTSPQRRSLTSPTPQLGLSAYQENTLLQRRNPTSSPPQLTLSAPQSNSRNINSAFAMVWMPEEQMWLITGEIQRDFISSHEPLAAPPAYTPTYTPRHFTRSEPSPTIRYQHDLSPPMSPVQIQLERLLEQQRREPLPEPPPIVRDEERFSPLFQEAMNSVPMVDPADLAPPPPPSLLPSDPRGKERITITPADRPTSRAQQNPMAVDPRSRSLSVGSHAAHHHSRNVSSSTWSYHTAAKDLNGDDIDGAATTTRSWSGVARKIARSASAMN